MRLLAATAATLSILSAPIVAQEVRAVLLIDRSGSMTLGDRETRSIDDARRCAEQVFADYASGGPIQVLVRDFKTIGTTTTITDRGWSSNMAGVNAALATVPAPVSGDLTPLAQAICRTTDDLSVLSTDICVIGIFTDGAENASLGTCGLPWDDNPTGACPRDPDVGSVGGFVGHTNTFGVVEQSWQQAVCAALEGVSHAPRPPLPPFFPPSRLIIRNYFYGDFAPSGAGGTGGGGGGLPALEDSLNMLRSAARAAGGSTVLSDDELGSRFREFRSDPWGACLNQAGHMQQLNIVRGGKLGEELLANMPGTQTSVVFLGFQKFDPPLSLGPIGAPLCGLSVNPVLSSPFEGRWTFPDSQGLIGVACHLQGIDWDGFNPPAMTPRWTWNLFQRLPPSAVITAPAADDTTCGPETTWDGFDPAAGKWYKDVTLSADIFDNEPVPNANIEWLTNRTDVQPALLGTGNDIVVRIFGDCFGTQHTITLRITDQEGFVITRTRVMLFWTLC